MVSAIILFNHSFYDAISYEIIIILDRELARFIYVREIKRFGPFKFSIYAWRTKIANGGSLAPVRLAWVPFLRGPKNGFIYVEADTKKNLCRIVA